MKSEYIVQYTKTNIRRFEIKLSKKYDKEVIDWLESQPNVNQYIKNLVSKDMKKSGN